MASIQKYFDDELRYLNEKGQEFAKEFPEKASQLNMYSLGDRDPYIERLFEGFAFLTSRVQQRLDNDFPEVAENLLELIAPEYLRPVPSLCMLEMSTRNGLLEKSLTLPKGARVSSNPVGKSLTPCQFQTSKSVDIFPMALKSASPITDMENGKGIKLTFQLEKGVDISSITTNSLCMYVYGDKAQAWSLINAITSSKSKVLVEINDVLQSQTMIKTPVFYQGGFSPEEELLPGNKSSLGYEGFIHELFSFDEKFRFIEIDSVDFLKNAQNVSKFSISIFSEFFNKIHISDYDGVFRLFVTPLVNLFTLQANPINLDLKSFEYEITTEKNRDIYSVDEVVGIEKNTGKRSSYRPYTDSLNSNQIPYIFRRHQNKQNTYGGVISVDLPDSIAHIREEYLSISLQVTDGNLPRHEVPINGISIVSGDFPRYIMVTNITRPSSTLYPPDKKDHLWYVLNHLNTNMTSLCQGDNLKKILELYIWTPNSPYKKLIDSLISVSSESASFIINNAYTRGVEVHIKFKDSFFENEGEAQLFGKVMLHFLTRYVSINYLVSLRFVSESTEKDLYWKPLEGQCQAL